MHLAEDFVAGITRPRPVSEGGPLVDALLLTTLSPNTAKIWLNVEIGDFASVETRDCGCLLGRLGLRTHLSGVRGFDKLTGEGVTFLRAHLEPILEQVLPTRFGGSALDYQIVEEEGPDGLPRLILRIAPSVGAVDPEEARAVLLRELGGQGGFVQQHMAALWHRAETLMVARVAPEITRAGKVLPFVPLRAPSRPARADGLPSRQHRVGGRRPRR
jgi:hypothetical protein